MNSKQEVRTLLKESGNFELWSEDVYSILLKLANEAGKRDKMLKQFWLNLEGMKEKYIHDLFLKNRENILSLPA